MREHSNPFNMLKLTNIVQPSTVKNPRMCSCSAPFYQGMHQEVTCANLRQPGIPECISHQSASVNGGGGGGGGGVPYIFNITVVS